MRARGAKILTLSCSWSPPPTMRDAAGHGQAIQHAKAAKVPIIVAINKIDKPDAKPEQVRTQVLQHEDPGRRSLGGDVLESRSVREEKRNLDKLLDVIALQSKCST